MSEVYRSVRDHLLDKAHDELLFDTNPVAYITAKLEMMDADELTQQEKDFMSAIFTHDIIHCGDTELKA